VDLRDLRTTKATVNNIERFHVISKCVPERTLELPVNTITPAFGGFARSAVSYADI
jgi:hypothetical protein